MVNGVTMVAECVTALVQGRLGDRELTFSRVAFFMWSAVWEGFKLVTIYERGTMSCKLCKEARNLLFIFGCTVHWVVCGISGFVHTSEALF